MKILSVPITSNFPYSELRRLSYDLLELRLDYAEQPLTAISSLDNHIQINSATIITLRDVCEGGKKSVSPGHKFALYSEMIKKYDCLVDCELKLFLKHRPSLPEQNLILSYHLPADCLDLSKTVLESIKKANKFRVRFLKLAVPINYYDHLDLLSHWQQNSENPLIVVGTGKLGKLSRIIWKLQGSPGTYLGMENYKTAYDQLTLDEYELYGCEQMGSNTLIGGLIGDEKVYNSLGLLFYNQKLRRLDNSVVYLPFPVHDLHDFMTWLRKMNTRNRFYGFSITMPHKSLLPLFFSVPNRIANLLSVRTDRTDQLPGSKSDIFQNTDIDAFHKALNILAISKDNTILVYGSGATASSFIKEFAAFPHITISARNKDNGIKFAKNHKIEYVLPENLPDRTFDLVMNCTPLGMNEENFFTDTGLHLPKSFIDLPYLKKQTKATEQCALSNIPYVDGKKFWLYQARRQEKIFSTNITQLL